VQCTVQFVALTPSGFWLVWFGLLQDTRGVVNSLSVPAVVIDKKGTIQVMSAVVYVVVRSCFTWSVVRGCVRGVRGCVAVAVYVVVRSGLCGGA
jgi:hypothetical protein